MESATTSLNSTGSPSSLALPAGWSDSRLAPKARIAAKDRKVDLRRAKACGGGGCPRPVEREPDEGGRFQAPAATNFKCDDNETAASRAAQLWVGAPFARPPARRGAPASVNGLLCFFVLAANFGYSSGSCLRHPVFIHQSGIKRTVSSSTCLLLGAFGIPTIHYNADKCCCLVVWQFCRMMLKGDARSSQRILKFKIPRYCEGGGDQNN